MAFSEIDLTENAIDVAVNCSATRIAVLHKQSVSLYRCKFATKPVEHPVLTRTFALPEAVARQISFVEEDQIMVLCSERDYPVDKFCHLRSEAEALSALEDLPSAIASVLPQMESSKTCFEDMEGGVIELGDYQQAELGSTCQHVAKLPAYCPTTEVWQDADQVMIFGLSSNGTLYGLSKAAGDISFQERLQIRNCTSFLITPAHLIFTTTQHLLKFVHLHQGELEIPSDEPEKDERCRSIERGAKLVTVMPTAFSLVLQMPRGNLETVYPRALVLAGIRKSIASKDYKTAFFACRNHRVDMNILHDYAPQQFMENVLTFAKQLRKPEHIDLFLSQLR